jgi:hypothetical protein
MPIERRPLVAIHAGTTINEHGRVVHKITIGLKETPIVSHEVVRESSEDHERTLQYCASEVMHKLDQLREDVRTQLRALGLKV